MKLIKHLKIIHNHRKYVIKACFKMGIPIQGILHDLSKYSIKELSICRYYSGTKSPHDNARAELGYSPSWINHFHKNKHHWEYWCETIFDGSWNPIKIPYKYVVEMFCDFIAAGKAYNKEKWKCSDPLDYWLKNCKGKRLMHIESINLMETFLYKLNELNSEKLFYKWYKENKKELIINYKK